MDPRINPFRTDLAAAHLKGKVEAKHFAEGTLYEIVHGQAPLRRAPAHDAALDTEALYGERVTVYDIDEEGWAWGQLETDGYVGYLPAAALARPGAASTHKIAALRTHGFPGADIKLPAYVALPYGARVAVAHQQQPFAVTAAGLFLPASHLVPLAAKETDFVTAAEKFLGTPYLWGGKTTLGIDCSGLVQIALQAAGIGCPRDSYMQEAMPGTPASLDSRRRGDLIFWKGHVAIARDAKTIIHANAFHMAVAIEATVEAIARIKKSDSEVTSVKRLA